MFNFKKFYKENGAGFLVGLGTGALILSNVVTFFSTMKFTREYDKLLKDKNHTKNTLKLVAKYYILPVTSIASGATAVVCGVKKEDKIRYALVAANIVADTAISQYRSTVKEIVGDQKAKQIEDANSKKQLEKAPIQKVEVKEGKTRFYEPLSRQYFESTVNEVNAAANRINRNALAAMDNDICFNDWLYELGLDQVDWGDERGWAIRRGAEDLLDISICAIVDDDNKPTLVIQYVGQDRWGEGIPPILEF